MKSYLPLIGYGKAYVSSDAFHDDRSNDTRRRFWALAAYKGEDDVQRTAEIMFITDSMPDFCGGLLIHSPRVDIFTSTNQWSSHFHEPGSWTSSEHPINLRREWKDLRVGVDAIDLALATGQEIWTDEEVRTYGHECMAAALAGHLMYTGKRGFVGADHTCGHMTNLFETMGEMGEFVATPVHPFRARETIGNLSRSYVWASSNSETMYSDLVDRFNVREDEEWYNTNSGNHVHWLMGNMSAGFTPEEHTEIDCENCGTTFDPDYYDYCPECEWDPSECSVRVQYQMPRGVLETVSNPDYNRRVRRHFWRNG